MAKITEIVRTSRSGSCPAGHDIAGEVSLKTGETLAPDLSATMVGIQGYGLANPDDIRQIALDPGEDVVVVPKELILQLADHIRAGQ